MTSSCELACAAAQIDTPNPFASAKYGKILGSGVLGALRKNPKPGELLPLADLDALPPDQLSIKVTHPVVGSPRCPRLHTAKTHRGHA